MDEFAILRRTTNLVGRPEAFVDVGPRSKNTEAWVAKELWPEAKVIGFEPSWKNYESLSVDYPGVLHPYGLLNQPARRLLYDYDNGNASIHGEGEGSPVSFPH